MVWTVVIGMSVYLSIISEYLCSNNKHLAVILHLSWIECIQYVTDRFKGRHCENGAHLKFECCRREHIEYLNNVIFSLYHEIKMSQNWKEQRKMASKKWLKMPISDAPLYYFCQESTCGLWKEILDHS